MLITAQKRSLWNKIQEATNLSGMAAETIFNPEFEEIMDELRDDTDDPIRSIISGEAIGKNPPETDGISCKELLKSARSNFNRREYMKCVGDLGRFHKKLESVVKILNGFVVNLDRVHHRFLFEQLTPDSKEYNKEYADYLEDLKNRFSSPKKANYQSELMKIAGIVDFFRNNLTERGRALAAWEKRYPSRVKELKRETLRLLDSSDKLLASILSSLKKMAVYRAKRQVDDYIKEGSRIVTLYTEYDKSFKTYYENQIKKLEQFAPLPKKIEEVEKASPEAVSTTVEEKAEQLGEQLVEKPKEAPVIEAPAITEVVAPTVEEKAEQLGRELSVETPMINPVEYVPPKAVPEVIKEVPPKAVPEVIKEVPPVAEVKTSKPPVVQRGKVRGGATRKKPASNTPVVTKSSNVSETPIEIITNPNAPKQIAEEVHIGTGPSLLTSHHQNIVQNVLKRQQEENKRKKDTAEESKAPTPVPTSVKSTQIQRPDITEPDIREMLDLPPLPKISHVKFFESLESLSNEQPIILAKYILKYANLIQDKDPETYNNLIDIVRSIKV